MLKGGLCAFYCYSSVFSHWRLPDYGKGNTSCYLSYSYLFGEESVTSLKNFCIQGYLFCIKEYSTSHFSIQIIIPWKWTRNENKENHLWKGRLSSCENKITWQEFFLITLTSTVTYKWASCLSFLLWASSLLQVNHRCIKHISRTWNLRYAILKGCTMTK